MFTYIVLGVGLVCCAYIVVGAIAAWATGRQK